MNFEMKNSRSRSAAVYFYTEETYAMCRNCRDDSGYILVHTKLSFEIISLILETVIGK